jgi:two-component system, OmpR family, phosphate regulon sensor histidine kinase PhoR
MNSIVERFRRDPIEACRAFLAIYVRPRTYLRLIYMAVALPLGFAYLMVLVVGAFIGAATAVVGVGLLVLLGCLVLAWVFAVIERELVIHLLGCDVAPLTLPGQEPLSSFRGLLGHLRRPTTWKSLAYLVMMVPLGAFSWGVGAIVVGLPTVLLIWVLTHLDGALVFFGVPGICALAAGLHVMNWIGGGWGGFASISLGVGEEERRAWEAEQRAEAAERSRSRLILSVSHELRTPIASIQGHLDSLLLPGADRPPPDEWERYVSVAASEARRLGRLVDELLMLARADADQIAIELRPVEVAPVLRSVVVAMEPLAKRERHVMLVCRPADGLVALADPNRMTQVLANLLRNAITHTPEGGAVSVETMDADSEVTIRVSDTGAGIAPDDLPHVFDRFYRADDSRSRDSGGFGLGLTIAKELVEKMGGSIGVTSKLGLGTTFEVHLRRGTLSPPTPDA